MARFTVFHYLAQTSFQAPSQNPSLIYHVRIALDVTMLPISHNLYKTSKQFVNTQTEVVTVNPTSSPLIPAVPGVLACPPRGSFWATLTALLVLHVCAILLTD